MTKIRHFRNADLPVLLDLWIQHWSSFGPAPEVTAAKFEQAVLARTFFDPTKLLLAETDEGASAFCHFSTSRESENSSVICSICLSASCHPATADELLASIKQRLVEEKIHRVFSGLVRDDTHGYAGLDPIGHGIGVPEADTRVGELLTRSGFRPEKSIKRMTASVAGYRAPVSREALQFRRSCSVESEVRRISDPRNASGMSHFDVERHRLVQRGGAELAAVKLWFSDPEAEVMPASMVILDISDAHQRGELTPAESFLIGSVIQELKNRRINTMESAVDADQGHLVSQLQAIQFQADEQGVRWEQLLV